MVVTRAAGLWAVLVDPAVPERWREPLYYRRIKAFARDGLEEREQCHTLVLIGTRTFLILPTKEVDVTNKKFIIVRNEVGAWDVLFFRDMESLKWLVGMMESNALTTIVDGVTRELSV